MQNEQRRQSATVATRSTWNTVPMPSQNTELPFRRHFSPSEFARIRQGVIPEQMEDKWVVFFENGHVFFHRSWTGYCIYDVAIEPRAEGYEVSEVIVNRDARQYRSTDTEHDADTLGFLFDSLLRR